MTIQLVFPLDKNDNPLYLDCLYKDLTGYLEQVNTSKNYLQGLIYTNPVNKEERYTTVVPQDIEDIRKAYPYLYNSQILKHVELIRTKIQVALLQYDYCTMPDFPYTVSEYRAGGYVLYPFSSTRLVIGSAPLEEGFRALELGDFVSKELIVFLEESLVQIEEAKTLFKTLNVDVSNLSIVKRTIEKGDAYIYIKDKQFTYRVPFELDIHYRTIEGLKTCVESYIKAKQSKKPIWLRKLLKEIE
jgi:hypothetical protein